VPSAADDQEYESEPHAAPAPKSQTQASFKHCMTGQTKHALGAWQKPVTKKFKKKQ
jgi:hypothetical protein